MKINGIDYRTIWCESEQGDVNIIDQTRLPFAFQTATLKNLAEACDAIKNMLVRGAPLVGATAAYGMALAMRDDPSDANLNAAADLLFKARPTAVNLAWALQRQKTVLSQANPTGRAALAYQTAAEICDEDVALNNAIGGHGLTLIQAIAAQKPGQTINILTHCNAGWLATVDWGTALSPIYKAHDAGIPVHVWVDETRPRNQGAYLSAYELGQHGVPHTVIVDNAGGHLMQHGLVDLCFVGTDRTTRTGDVCNKIGTYLKALAAHDNQVPFYVCAPSPSIDFALADGLQEIPIEQRPASEVSHILGLNIHGQPEPVNILPTNSPARNDAFDVTPSKYVSALVTEKGIIPANEAAIRAAFGNGAT